MSSFHHTEIGNGTVTASADGSYHLHVSPADTGYHDAQITTYMHRSEFTHHPLTHLHVRAHTSGAIRGTAGFGFWNHPFAPNERGFRLPRAAWFFCGSPPNNMALAKGVPGHGWKCATIDATRKSFLALLPLAIPGFALMHVPPLYRLLWPVGQRALGVSEHPLDESLLDAPHDYDLAWERNAVTFRVDGTIVHRAPVRLRGPLGFIAWVDNQYAIVTPRGKVGFGLLDLPAEQSLTLENLRIE